MLHYILTEPNYSPIRNHIISHIVSWKDGVSLWLAVPKILYDSKQCTQLFIMMMQYNDIYGALKHAWTQIITDQDKLFILNGLRYPRFFWNAKKGSISESMCFLCNYIVPLMSKSDIVHLIGQMRSSVQTVSAMNCIMHKIHQSFPAYDNMYNILYVSCIRSYDYEIAHTLYVSNIRQQQCIRQKRDKHWHTFIHHYNRHVPVSATVNGMMLMAQDIGLYSWQTFCLITNKMYYMYDKATADEKMLIKNAIIQLDAMFLQRQVKFKWKRAVVPLWHCRENDLISSSLPKIWKLLLNL